MGGLRTVVRELDEARGDAGAAVRLVLRAATGLGALALASGIALAALGSLLRARGGAPLPAALAVALAGALLAAGGALGLERAARLAGLGACGVWDHRRAACLVRALAVAVVAAGLAAALALWFA